MRNRTLAMSIGVAVGVIALGSHFIGQARDVNARMASLAAAPGVPSQPAPGPDARQKPASPLEGLDAVASRLAHGLYDGAERGRAEALVAEARQASSEGRDDVFQSDLAALSRMARDMDVECTVVADTTPDGTPVVVADPSTGRPLAKSTCWGAGGGDVQRTSAGTLVHATDFDAWAVLSRGADAGELALQASRSGGVYGVKAKGRLGVAWTVDALKDGTRIDP